MDKQTMDMLKQILEGQQALRTDIGEIKVDISTINQRLDGLEDKTGVVIEEVARLREDVTDIKDALNSVEVVTARNWSEIAKLKSVK